jgi:hypothetical protein
MAESSLPTIPNGACMQTPEYELRRNSLPRTPVNRGVRRLPEETSPVTAQRPRGYWRGLAESMFRTKSGQQSRNTQAAVEPGRDREIIEPRRSRRLREARAQPLDGCMLVPALATPMFRAAQQSKTDQHTSLRNLWSSSTSSRISPGSCARCHWHSRRPACSRSPSGAAARAALIA